MPSSDTSSRSKLPVLSAPSQISQLLVKYLRAQLMVPNYVRRDRDTDRRRPPVDVKLRAAQVHIPQYRASAIIIEGSNVEDQCSQARARRA